MNLPATSITAVTALPVSFEMPPQFQVRLGIGMTVKRDAVIVRVDTADGLTGWGEAHAARAPTAIAELINSTLGALVVGMDSGDPEAVWERVYRAQLASHGAGAAAVIGLSGIDIALWDVCGQRAGQPLFALLGGAARDIPAYAGGIALGFEPEDKLAAEASTLVGNGFSALKLRIGDSCERDLARVVAVREAVGADTVLLSDANTALQPDEAQALIPLLEQHDIGWLEEPFPAHDFRAYRSLRDASGGMPSLAIAAGENHYTRFDFERALDDGVISVWQPDVSKCGGVTEIMRIARLAAASDIAIHPHTSVTGINMAASLHVLSAIENAGYYEADTSGYNPLRDDLCTTAVQQLRNGQVRAPEGAGLGINIDTDRLAEFTAIPGPGYV